MQTMSLQQLSRIANKIGLVQVSHQTISLLESERKQVEMACMAKGEIDADDAIDLVFCDTAVLEISNAMNEATLIAYKATRR